jgi:hypothetical protein
MSSPDENEKTLFQSLQNFGDFKHWLSDHKLQALGIALL